MLEVLLEKDNNWKVFSSPGIKIYFKGYLYNLEEKNFIQYFNSINSENIKDKIDFLNGHFGIFVHSNSFIFGATDITQLRKILAGINLKLDSEINDEIQILYKKFPLTF